MTTRYMKMRAGFRVAGVLLLLPLSGCVGVDGVSSANVLIPPEVVNLSKSVSIPLESIAAGAVLYKIIDPLAPNWQIEQLKLDDSRYRIAMRKKRFTTGGDGEAMPAFNRRAEQLMRENGAARYLIIEFSEGVDSAVPIAQRVAQGVVQLVR